MTYTETELVGEIERLAGADLAALTQPQRDQFDQFHSGGSEAVDRLLPSLQLAPGMVVLDVGSGLGGPARQIARGSGCTVVGVDITSAYVDTAQALTRTAGLDNHVSFICSDIAALDRDGFDAAYTMHVQMNVADKEAFFAEIARRLRPWARFATFEICVNGATQPTRFQRLRDPRLGRRDPVGTSMVRGPRQTHSRRRRSYPSCTPHRWTDPNDELRRRPCHRRRVSSPRLVHPRDMSTEGRPLTGCATCADRYGQPLDNSGRIHERPGSHT